MKLRVDSFGFLDWGPLSFGIESAEIVCLIGQSGSGKSLLLRAIADLIVSEGEVDLSGERREGFEPTEWRRRVGYLPAEILWWEETVGEHFLSPPDAAALERMNLPRDTNDWSPSRLSMGERQRLGILRMLDRSPEVLLLDEPTSNLDEKSAAVVEALILGYVEEHSASALWVTHSAAQANRVGRRVLEMIGKALREIESGVSGG